MPRETAVEPIINDMVRRFEDGGLTRRQLIRGLSALVAASQAQGALAAAAQSQPAAVTATGIDHVSVLVSDVEKSATFYKSLFGLSVLSEDQEHGILRLGAKRVMVSIRKEQPYGTVDHFGVRVENFDKAAVAQTLMQRGLKPDENWQYGFYVKDPDGVNVQLL
jgi:catechol 2,3-dioxygenase-like lactoylglutathione lyase family enzyme